MTPDFQSFFFFLRSFLSSLVWPTSCKGLSESVWKIICKDFRGNVPQVVYAFVFVKAREYAYSVFWNTQKGLRARMFVDLFWASLASLQVEIAFRLDSTMPRRHWVEEKWQGEEDTKIALSEKVTWDLTENSLFIRPGFLISEVPLESAGRGWGNSKE